MARSTLKKTNSLFKPVALFVLYFISILGTFELFNLYFKLSAPFELLMEVEYQDDLNKNDQIQIFVNGMGNPIKIATQGSGKAQYSFDLKPQHIKSFRIDPSDFANRNINITKMELSKVDINRQKQPLKIFDLSELNPEVSTSGMQRISSDSWLSTNNDPIIQAAVNIELPNKLDWDSLAWVQFGFLGIIALIYFSLSQNLKFSIAQFSTGAVLKSKKSRNPLYVSVLCGFATLLLLNTNRHFYLPSELRMLEVQDKNQEYSLQWDSGHGFNDLESMQILPAETGLTFALPQIELRAVKISPNQGFSKVQLAVGSIEIKPQDLSVDAQGVAEIRSTIRTEWSWVIFVIQIFGALLISMSVYWLSSKKWKAIFSESDGAKLARIRCVFFLYTFPIFATWVVGQWPGAMSYDSAFLWDFTKQLRFAEDHPILNSLFLLLIQQFYDGVALVAVIQATLSALLISYIFGYFYNEGLRLRWIFPFWALLVTSIPIGLYNLILWKDIPFALTMVFFAFYLYRARLISSAELKPLRLSFKTISILFAIGLGFYFRHGGHFFPLIWIVLAAFTKTIAKRSLAALFVGFLAMGILFNETLPKLLKSDDSSLPFYKAFSMLNMMGAFYSHKYYSPNYSEDYDAFKLFVNDLDGLNAYMPTNIAPIHAKGVRLRPSNGEVKKISESVMRAAILNPWIFFSDRVSIFFSTMSEMRQSTYHLTFSNVLHSRAIASIYPSANVLYLQTQPLSQWLHLAQEKLIENSHFAGNAFEGKHLIWNSVLHFFLIFGTLFLARWFPAASMFSLFILSAVGVVFLTIPTNNWRYLYFMYLAGFFTVPLLVFENRAKRNSSSALSGGKPYERNSRRT